MPRQTRNTVALRKLVRAVTAFEHSAQDSDVEQLRKHAAMLDAAEEATLLLRAAATRAQRRGFNNRHED
jgi:hypothetical protein